MNENDLKELGLSPEQIEGVINKFNEELDGKYVTKEVFNAKNEELKQAKSHIAERDEQINSLDQYSKDNEELKRKIASIVEENNTAMKKYETELATERKRSKIKDRILSNKDYKAHDLDLVLSQLDINNINVTNDELVGFKEQFDNLVTNKSFLFEKVEKPTNTYKGFTPHDSNASGISGPNNGNKGVGDKLVMEILKDRGVIK